MTEEDRKRLAEIEARHELAQEAASDSCSLFMIEAIDDIPASLHASNSGSFRKVRYEQRHRA